MSQRLNVRPAVGAQKEFCEEQDERVTKCGILSSVRAPVWPHRAHRSLSLPEIKGLIIKEGKRITKSRRVMLIGLTDI